jgi:hypothetical protein
VLATRAAAQANPRRRNNRCRVRRPDTPHVNFDPQTRDIPLSSSGSSSGAPRPVPNLEIRPINQANQSESIFPRIQKPRPVHAQRLSAPSHTPPVGDQAFVEVTTDSEEISRARSITPQELFCYYPEQLYVSATLPTRNHIELTLFRDWCQTQYQNTQGIEVVYNHPPLASRPRNHLRHVELCQPFVESTHCSHKHRYY